MTRCPDLVDGTDIKPSDLDLAFVSCNSIKSVWPYCPDRLLIRFKFLEAVVRLGIDKYYKTKVVDSFVKALEMAFKLNFIPFFKQFNCQRMRLERIWRQENDVVLRRLESAVTAMYKSNAGKYS
jgi:hypothetical protein